MEQKNTLGSIEYDSMEIQEPSLLEKELGFDFEIVGYRILLKPATFPQRTLNGLILPEDTLMDQTKAHRVGQVIGIGNLCFQPTEKFGGLRYCEVGDWVVYANYERDEMKHNGKMFYWINDERIYGRAKKPEQLIPQLKLLREETETEKKFSEDWESRLHSPSNLIGYESNKKYEYKDGKLQEKKPKETPTLIGQLKE